MAGDRSALQFDLFGEQTGSGLAASVGSPPMITSAGWQLPETSIFVGSLKRGALADSIAAIRRLKVDTAWKVLLEAGFTVGTGKTHGELLAPLQKDLMEAAQRKMSGLELRAAREAARQALAEKDAKAEHFDSAARNVAERGELANAATRTYDKQAIVFDNPLVGPSGVKLVSYQWQWQPVSYVDQHGEDRTKRISDWEKAEVSGDTGREIVHQFQVVLPDGSAQLVSQESAIKVLGFAADEGLSQFTAMASGVKTLARLRMQLAEGQAMLEARLKDQAEVDAFKLLPIERQDGNWWSMGDARVRQPQGGDAITDERKNALIGSWRDKRMAERGWTGEVYSLREILADVQNRLAKQEAKFQSTRSTVQTAPDASGQALTSDQPVDITLAHQVVAERFGIPARSVAEIAQLAPEILVARDKASDNILPNSMTPASFESQPLGSVRLSTVGGDFDNRYIDYLREFDSQVLVTAEAEQGIKQHPTYGRYLEWAKSGKEIPPISVYEVGDGVLQSTNRRRTLVAQELGLTVKGWFGVVNKETGLPLKYGDVRSALREIERQKAPNQPQLDEELRTGDAGAELTYNRRNRVKRGLVWSDLEGLETALRVREVTKAKVYPRPDYQGLIDSGIEPVHAHLVKQVYDSLAAKPTANNPTDDQLQAYITGVNRVMAGTLSWVRDPNGAKVWNGRRATGNRMLDHVYPDGWKELRNETSLLGGRYFSALQPGYTEERRAKAAVADGWPDAQEAWQKQGFSVVSVEAVSPSFYVGKNRDGSLYVSVRLVDGRGKAILDDLRVDGAQDKDDPAVLMKIAARSAELVNRFALVNKRGHLVSAHESEAAAMEAARESVRRGGEAGISDSGISVEVAQRIGAARRVDGENVSSEQVLATFGFRGINFGNWMKGKGNEAERQLHLNHIYDAFLDLAEILDLPPKAMSLDGMLGVAVGAQGGGSALAHFVPGVNEINLTRTSGAGALAHEWAHALDHYFARLAGLDRSDTPFLSAHALLPPTLDRMVQVDGKWQRAKEDRFGEGLRPEMREHFGTVVKAMTKRPISNEELAAQTAAALERTKENVSRWLKAIRRDFESDRVRSTMVAYRGESVSVLDAFDDLSRRIQVLDLGGDLVAVSRNKAVSPVVAEIRELYKAGTGRLYSLDNTMGLQSNVDSLRYQLSAEDGARAHMPQMVSTEFAKAAAKLDSGKQTAYWSTALEMFARSFDVFVSEKLEARTAMNSYLSHTGRADETTPVGDERRIVVEAIGNLVGEVRTRETEKGGVALFSFGGQRANVADERLLTRAEQRLAAGEDAEVVRRETGWFKGADEKWRFEIDDSGAKLKKPFPHNGAAFGDTYWSVFKNRMRDGMLGLRVGDILDHPSLFAAYPQIADISLSTQPGLGASYVLGSAVSPRSIEIGEQVPMYEVASMLLHEIQHGIQTIEGFATGGSPKMASLPTNEEFARRINAKFHQLMDEAKQSPEYLAYVEAQIASFSGETRFVPGRSRQRDLAAEAAENAAWDKFLQSIETERLQQIDKFLAMSPGLDDKHGVYSYLAGEVEARNVQARMKLSDAERRATEPAATADVPQRDVIVLFNGREMRAAPLPANVVGEEKMHQVRQPHSVASLKATIDGAFSGTKDFSRLLEATGRFEIIEAKDLPAGLTGARMSVGSVAERDRGNIETAARRMAKFVDAFVAGQVKDQDTQIIGDTPTVLQGLGAHDLPLQIDGQTVKKILGGKHRHLMTADMLKGAAQYIYDPLMVFNSPGQNGGQGKLVITEIPDRLGAPVVVAIHLDKLAGRLVINDIASVYGMDGSDKRLVAMAANLEYVRNDKGLGPSTTPNHTYMPGLSVVQKARSLGVNLLTETDIVKQYGLRYSVASSGQTDSESPDIHYSKDGRILGYVVDGHTKLVADNISQVDNDVRGLLMHEIGVHALHLGRSDSEFQQILSDFEKLRDQGDDRVVDAFGRVPADTAPHLVSEEALGYFVEANPRLPFTSRVLSWFKAQVVKIADHLPAVDQSRLATWARALSPDDLVYMASAATRNVVEGLAMREKAPGREQPGTRSEGRGR